MKLRQVKKNYNGWVLLYETDGNKSFVIMDKPISCVPKFLLDYEVVKLVSLHDDLIALELREN